MPVDPGVVSDDGSVKACSRPDSIPASELFVRLLRRPPWMADAACQEHPEVNFFPVQGEKTGAAKAVCAGCLVRSECLAFAAEHGEFEKYANGVWGGTSAYERQRAGRAARRARSAA